MKAPLKSREPRMPRELRQPSLRTRASGVLLHPTSLPGPHGSGDIGESARRFVDFLSAASQRWWQMLPVGPPGYGESPYSAESAFAGNPFLVSLDELAVDGLLDPRSLAPASPLRADRMEFVPMAAHRGAHLRAAFAAFSARPDRELLAFRTFRDENAGWLDDFALFRALKGAHGGAQWTKWDPGVRAREPRALDAARKELAPAIALERFVQYVFDRQWTALRAYAAARGVGFIGDLPIFVAHDSADVWQNPDAFFLDREGEPSFVAGVPPDYFSATGQRWGNPLYRWNRMKKTGYAWWIARLRTTLRRFDVIRLDHFIGFERYWKIPASEPTAIRGRWMKGPGADFFDTVKRALGDLPLIAEDLGEVTPRVIALRERYRLPGIRILQFAFGNDKMAPSFLPHNYPRRAAVYTGTHDNDTAVGWFYDPGAPENPESTRSAAQVATERALTLRYLGPPSPTSTFSFTASAPTEIHWDMIRASLASVARLAVFPLQDVLGLGSDARMNRPGTAQGNWTWRFEEGALSAAVSARLGEPTRAYGRAPVAPLGEPKEDC
jgi:4-alpha-glucanotransferase